MEAGDVPHVQRTLELMRRVPPPGHSHFLVAATIVYEDAAGETRWLQGVNSETCNLTAAICAERCAMLQLRLQPSGYRHLRAVYITTTSLPGGALVSPGLLCREFMQELRPLVRTALSAVGDPLLSERASGDVRIVLFSADLQLGLELEGDAAGSPEGGAVGSGSTVGITRGRLEVHSLAQLYPLPPLYNRVDRDALLATAKAFSGAMQRFEPGARPPVPLPAAAGDAGAAGAGAACGADNVHPALLIGGMRLETGFEAVVKGVAVLLAAAPMCAAPALDPRGLLAPVPHPLCTPSGAPCEAGIVAALRLLYASVVAAAGEVAPSSDHLYPLHLAAGLLLSDGTFAVARQHKGLEYGCTLEATSQLALLIDGGRTAAGVCAAAAAAAAAGDSASKAGVEAEGSAGFAASGGSSGSCACGEAAAPATARCSEPGCPATPLPAGGPCGHARPAAVPLLLLQADQYGILQAPNAPSRAWLTEFGHGAVLLPVHDRDTGALVAARAETLSPAPPDIPLGTSTFCGAVIAPHKG